MRRIMKLLVVILLCLGIFGCATTDGINPVPINAAIETGFYFALKNNPQYKPTVVAGLTGLKVFLTGNVTYDQLMAEILKRFPGDTAAFGVIISGWISTDMPWSTSMIPLSDTYKQAIIKEVDKLLLLAELIQ